jgi:molecular chaperone DnaK
MVHTVKKALTEHGDKVGADEKSKIEAALAEADAVLKDQNASKDALDARAQALQTSAQKLGEAIYASAQQGEAAHAPGGGGGAGSAGAGAGTGGSGGGPRNEEKVVDAEFTEVKDRK